jgi:hypothetical protein
LYLPTDIHWLFVTKNSTSTTTISSSFSSTTPLLTYTTHLVT